MQIHAVLVITGLSKLWFVGVGHQHCRRAVSTVHVTSRSWMFSVKMATTLLEWDYTFSTKVLWCIWQLPDLLPV